MLTIDEIEEMNRDLAEMDLIHMVGDLEERESCPEFEAWFKTVKLVEPDDGCSDRPELPMSAHTRGILYNFK